ncbi:hypothetical protein, partial [uncultured Sulfitobacter sp.]|uniref:hypothetical protein n=1 Tax=uncultured Sulfitobacter sp. TaxID=191468 RepID=UPI0026019132
MNIVHLEASLLSTSDRRSLIEAALSYFFEGMDRFLSVMDGNADYDKIIATHLGEDALEAFAPDVPIGTRREEAVARSRAA